MAVSLAWIAVLLVAPLGAMIAWSIATRGAAGDISWTITLDNFRRLAGFDAFGWVKACLSILGSTIVVFTLTTLLYVALAYPLAFFIAVRPPGRRYLWLAIIIPFCANVVIRTYAWMLLLSSQMLPACIAQRLRLANGIVYVPVVTPDIVFVVGMLLVFEIEDRPQHRREHRDDDEQDGGRGGGDGAL
jgi:spermidine/putrescine transport system permease protein